MTTITSSLTADSRLILCRHFDALSSLTASTFIPDNPETGETIDHINTISLAMKQLMQYADHNETVVSLTHVHAYNYCTHNLVPRPLPVFQSACNQEYITYTLGVTLKNWEWPGDEATVHTQLRPLNGERKEHLVNGEVFSPFFILFFFNTLQHICLKSWRYRVSLSSLFLVKLASDLDEGDR